MRIYLNLDQTNTVLKALKEQPKTKDTSTIIETIEKCVELQKREKAK